MDIIVANNNSENAIYRANEAMQNAVAGQIDIFREQIGLDPTPRPPLHENKDTVVARNVAEYGIYQLNRAMKHSASVDAVYMQKQLGQIIDQTA